MHIPPRLTLWWQITKKLMRPKKKKPYNLHMKLNAYEASTWLNAHEASVSTLIKFIWTMHIHTWPVCENKRNKYLHSPFHRHAYCDALMSPWTRHFTLSTQRWSFNGWSLSHWHRKVKDNNFSPYKNTHF